MKALRRKFLPMLMIFSANANAYLPQFSHCKRSYQTETDCISDCGCGWCLETETCLNGDASGPFPLHFNEGLKCEGKNDWNHNKKCELENTVIMGILGGLVLTAVVVGVAGYYRVHFSKAIEVQGAKQLLNNL